MKSINFLLSSSDMYPPPLPPPRPPLLLLQVYSRSFNGCSFRPPKRALSGISLAIPTGECFGLLGVNGEWSSTCVRSTL